MFEHLTYEGCNEIFEERQTQSSIHWSSHDIQKSLQRIYKLGLPAYLVVDHTLLYIFMLMKCFIDHSLILPIKNICIKDNLSYEEMPIQILHRSVCKLRFKEVALVNVLWSYQFVEEDNLEDEQDTKKRYPHRLSSK